jgi:integrase
MGNFPDSFRFSQGEHTRFTASRATDQRPPRVTAHALRHTAASLAISTGANPKVVARMLGHASAAMTLDVYADLFESDLDSVAENVGKLWARQAN